MNTSLLRFTSPEGRLPESPSLEKSFTFLRNRDDFQERVVKILPNSRIENFLTVPSLEQKNAPFVKHYFASRGVRVRFWTRVGLALHNNSVTGFVVRPAWKIFKFLFLRRKKK